MKKNKTELFWVVDIDKEGKLMINKTQQKLISSLSSSLLLKAYKLMCFSRLQESLQAELNKDKKVMNFLSSTGQEATEVGYAIHLKKGVDWFVPGYRNNAAWITAGYPFEKILQYWLGNERGSFVPEGTNVLPVCIPIATQFSHAVGIAYAEKYKGKKGVVITTIGEGGTGEGEFFEAMNFATLKKLPVIFIIENNQFALSTTRERTTLLQTFSEKGNAVGIENWVVDGNDFLAVYHVVGMAVKQAREKSVPTLIECVTYRQNAHSAFDIEKDYFDQGCYQRKGFWLKKDPLMRLRIFLSQQGLWDEKKEKDLLLEQEKEIRKTIKFVLQQEKDTIKQVLLKSIFAFTYSKMTPHLSEQFEEAKLFFSGEEDK